MVPNVEGAFITPAGSERRQTHKGHLLQSLLHICNATVSDRSEKIKQAFSFFLLAVKMLLCHTNPLICFLLRCLVPSKWRSVTLSTNSAGNFTGSEHTGDLQLIGLTKNRETEKNQRDGSVEKKKVWTGTDVYVRLCHI